MRAIITIGLAAALLAGCSKTSDSSTASDATSPAADAAAGTATAAAAAPAAIVSPDAAGSPDAAQSPDTASPTTGASADAIDLPIYPGAQQDADHGLSMSTGSGSLKLTVLTTKDSSRTVVDWYKAHLPASWKNVKFTTGDKTMGSFASNDGGKGTTQSVNVTSEDGETRIQLTTKKGN